MVYFLARITGEHGTRIILCFSIFSQLWLLSVSTDINSRSLKLVMHLSERQTSAFILADKCLSFRLCQQLLPGLDQLLCLVFTLLKKMGQALLLSCREVSCMTFSCVID